MSETKPGTGSRPPGRTGLGWRRLQVLGAIGALTPLVAFVAISGEFDPFLLILAVPILIGLILLRWAGRIGVIWLGVVSFLLLALNAAFAIQSFRYPEAPFDFIPLLVLLSSLLLIVIATIPAFRQGRGPDRGSASARNLLVAFIIVVIAGSAWSLVAAAGFEGETARPGDTRLVTEDFEFVPNEVTAPGGRISVHVRNVDPVLHTFTIDELGVDLAVPGRKESRVTFEVEPGKTYTFYCQPHAGMDGKLTVE
jgi:plastocyanin